MASLLGLNSPAPKQVPSRQSLRGQKESSAATHGTLTHDPESKAYRSSKENAEFFKRMKGILLKQENMQRAVEAQEESDIAPPPGTTDQAYIPGGPTKTELDLLYEEAIYTVKNKAGVPLPEYVASEAELYRYLQKVFDVSSEEHEAVLQKVQESKRASFSLKVSVMKGKNLLAKDANGYSDPYCMLGIITGQSSQEPEEKKERKFSFRKKKDRMEKHPNIRDVLAAKCIRVTEVKPETLNPIWNEHFVFEIDDVQNDQLHLDIWDHDDDVSVSEACKKLNEVSGLRGMGRYFKQIAKSVRTNGNAASTAEENVDDFLGCVNVPINEIPLDGYDKWFKLEPRSSASKVQGECHLILKLFTTQRDTTLSKSDSPLTIHEKLLSQIVAYEHQQVQTKSYNWDGRLSKPARVVMCHHAVQTDLSPLKLAIIRWQCYSSHHRFQQMCYSFLLGLLRTIEEEWDASAVQGELETCLADSFSLHVEYCMFLLKHLRQVFPCSNPTAIGRCDFMLRGLGFIQTMQAFKTVCPLRHHLQLDIAAVIKKSTKEWYDGLTSHYRTDEGTLEEQLRRIVLVVDTVCADVQRGQNVYNQIFCSSVKVDFFIISYCQLEKMVANSVNTAMEKVCGTLEQESFQLSESMGETLFELYISTKTLKLFREFLPLKDIKILSLTGFHDWFKTSLHRWLQIVHEKSCDRIHLVVDVDQLEPIDLLSKHSTSAADVTAGFSQVRVLWQQLAWPDSAGAFSFVSHLTDDVCSEAVLYSELMKRKIERTQLGQGQDNKMLTTQLCVALNNIEHVQAFLGNLSRDLDWHRVERAMEELCMEEGMEQVNKSLKAHLYNTNLDLQREVNRMVKHLTDKMLLDLKKYIQHISLSPDSINNDDAVSPLMKYLDDTLVIFSECLVKENLARVLLGLWWLLLRMIFDTVLENRGVSVEFYGRFHFTVEALVEFFHAEGDGLPLEELRNEDYKALEEELRLNKCSSNELIEQYFLEKIAQQKALKQSRFGRISLKCYYEAQEQRLTVEVLHAADLIALDANGLSDPFVIVELCPHHLFPAAKSQRTQVKPKTLHPVFDELFHFHVSPEECKQRSACVALTVMDYDWLSANDFAGEATAALSDFCWLDKPSAHGGSKTVQPLLLHLTQPKLREKPIVKMLEARTSDKEAQEFVRKLKEIERSMGEKE